MTSIRIQKEHKTAQEVLSDNIKAGRKRLLDINETALYLGLAPRTIYNGSGRKAEKPFPVKPKRIGRKLLWDVRQLDAFIDSLGGAGE